MFHFLPSIEVKFKRGVKRGSFGARGVDEIKPSVRLGWMHPDMRQRVRAALLDFYDTHARLLPFRGEKDPYAIWLSEIMAQQTRIETLIPYFERFIERFPTIESLAHASEDEVLSLWSGLGYYRRAKLLHECAKILARDHGGEMPRDAAARLALPGIGRYTAGAIGSIAFDLEEPIVDGNVTRVLSRLRGWEELIGSAALEKKLWTEAEALVRGPRPGDLNQAMMELGATVCVPRSPACSECPIGFACTAQKTATRRRFQAQENEKDLARKSSSSFSPLPRAIGSSFKRAKGACSLGFSCRPMQRIRAIQSGIATPRSQPLACDRKLRLESSAISSMS